MSFLNVVAAVGNDRVVERSRESPKYRNTTEIPVKNIGIAVKDTY